MRYCFRIVSVGMLCIVLLFAGCHSQYPALPSSSYAEKTEVKWDKYYDLFKNNLQFNSLNDRLQQCYGTIYTILADHYAKDEWITVVDEQGASRETIGVDITFPVFLDTVDEVESLFNAFSYDNPQIFYIGSTFFIKELYLYEKTYYTGIKIHYTMDADSRIKAIDKLDRVVADILNERPMTDDQYEVELYLHDKLAAICTYDFTAENAEFQYPHSFSAYGALVEGKAVCTGYSQAMQLLLKRIGIPCTVITGHDKQTGTPHMWNLVTINGKNYHLDVTWNDSHDHPIYNYFNIPTTQIEATHSIDDKQPSVDTCVTYEDNYHRRSGTYIEHNDRYEIALAIAQQIIDGNDIIQLAFHEDVYDSAALFLKNQLATSQLVNIYLSDTKQYLRNYSLSFFADDGIVLLKLI